MAAKAVGPLERAFMQAGGKLRNCSRASNNLTGDLTEAGIVRSVKDPRWLASAADRTATR